MGDFTKTPRPFYPPLSSGKREIRLLHLKPGTGDTELRCRLRVVSLDSNPSYEALSYCWGEGTSNVLVDGNDVMVPQNLDTALRRFRYADRERILWSDAICIDQSQTEERNAQVALMADIYRKCERCLVFLGNTDARDESLEGLDQLLNALSKKHHFDEPGAPHVYPMFGFTRIPLMFLNMAAWWERIWVVQEVILAPQSLVVFGALEMLFSDLVRAVEFLDEHDIGSAWGSSRHETDDLCHCMDHIKVTFIWADLLDLRDHVYRLLETGRPQAHVDNHGESEAALSATHGERQSTDIVGVMLGVRHRKCTDARDKIFGVLSLVQDWGSWEPIRADYSKQLLQVYIEFATQMLQSPKYELKTLLLARGAELHSSALTGLPSWAPDWSRRGSPYDKYLMTLEKQAASQPSPPDTQTVSVLGPTLKVHHALRVATITAVSTPGQPIHKTYGQPTDGESYRRFTAMLDSWRTFAGVKNPITTRGLLDRYLPPTPNTTTAPDPPPTDPTTADFMSDSGSWTRLLADIQRSHTEVDFVPQIQAYLDGICHYQAVFRQMMDPDEETFYRTLIHNTYPLHLRQPQYHCEALCILRLFLIFCNSFIDPDRFLTRLNSVVLGKMAETVEMVQIWRRRLFRAEGGLLGIGFEGVRAGDEVVCFRGVETPFVLRRLEETQTAAVEGEKGVGGRYMLVGYCYVDGLNKREELDWEAAGTIYLE